MTEDSRETESDQLRRRLTTEQSRKVESAPELFPEEKEYMKSRLKKARAHVSELLQDAFLATSARFKEKQWFGLNRHEQLLFLEAVSKQLNAWQENAAATLIPQAEAKVTGRTLSKQGFQDRVVQSRFVVVNKNEGKSMAEFPLDTKASARIVVPGLRRSRCVGHSQRLTNRMPRSHQCPAGYQRK